jgi:glycosyltransferase involved in cell wall biosynthesis
MLRRYRTNGKATPKPMKVAIDVRRARHYGVGTYIRNIVNHLGRADGGARYLLFGDARDRDQFDTLPENFEWAEHSFPLESFRDQLLIPLLLRNREVDVLHVPWLYSPFAAPCPVVITVHDLTELIEPHAGLHAAQPPGSRRRPQSLRRQLGRRALARAARIFAVSEASKRELIRVFGLPEEKIEVVYNALDERFLTEPLPADADRILERHAIDYPFVLYAGNIRPQKNLSRLIEAFAVVKGELRDHPQLGNLKLIVIGDELAKHPDLRRAVVRTRMREEVRFLGFVPHGVLRVFYARARAFLFPSLYEGFGLPPLEAMAHGTPVVTSNVSSLPEVFGPAALLVNPENVFDIARGIRTVLTDELLRAELIKRGPERVKLYSWERAAGQIRRVYEEVASGK